MKRRDVLAGVGAAGLAGTAGCAGLVTPACEPTDDSLASLYQQVNAGTPPGWVTVRGVVRSARRGLVLHDGTGWGTITVGSGESVPGDISEGDCVKATGIVLKYVSLFYGTVAIEVEPSGVSTVGFLPAESDPDPVPEPPDAEFGVDEGTTSVEVRHVGGPAVPASHLEVRRAPPDAPIESSRWHERAGVPPDAKVSEGDSITVSDPGVGHLVWRPEETFATPITRTWQVR